MRFATPPLAAITCTFSRDYCQQGQAAPPWQDQAWMSYDSSYRYQRGWVTQTRFPSQCAVYPVQILSIRERKASQRLSAPGPFLPPLLTPHTIPCCRLQSPPAMPSANLCHPLLSFPSPAHLPFPISDQSLLVCTPVSLLSQFRSCSLAPRRAVFRNYCSTLPAPHFTTSAANPPAGISLPLHPLRHGSCSPAPIPWSWADTRRGFLQLQRR